MRKHRLAGALVVLLAGLASAAAYGQDGNPVFQPGWSRSGPIFNTLTKDSARTCQRACLDNSHCRAWVYSTNDNAQNCRLMSQDPPPPPTQDACCVTGAMSD